MNIKRVAKILEEVGHYEDEIFRRRKENDERQKENAKRRKVDEARRAQEKKNDFHYVEPTPLVDLKEMAKKFVSLSQYSYFFHL